MNDPALFQIPESKADTRRSHLLLGRRISQLGHEAAQLTAAQAAYDAAKAAFESASEALVAAGGTPD